MLYYIKHSILLLRKHPPCDLHKNNSIRLTLINAMLFSLVPFSHYLFRGDTTSFILFQS